jgi:hypothetical protein
MSEPEPCMLWNEEAEYKTIGLPPCERCGWRDCWLAYLLWERRAGVDLNKAEWEKLP